MSTLSGVTPGVVPGSGPDEPFEPQGVLTASVFGLVVNEANESLVGIAVVFYRLQSGSWSEEQTVFTDATGNYVNNLLPPATYRLGFRDPAGNYLPTFLGGDSVETASDVILLAGDANFLSPVALVPVPEPVVGAIDGRVVSVISGEGLPRIQLTAFAYNQSNPSASAAVATVESAADGSFRISGLAFGTYIVRFGGAQNAGYVPSFFGGGLSPQTAQTVAISAAAPVAEGIEQPLEEIGLETLVRQSGDNWLLKFRGNPFVTYQVETSTDLENYGPDGAPFVPLADGSHQQTVIFDALEGRQFWRVSNLVVGGLDAAVGGP